VVVATWLVVRPVPAPRWKTLLGSVFVGVLCLVVAVPSVVAARYAMVQADLVETVFGTDQSATVPQHVTKADPWGGRRRLNILLLGGDGGQGRIGVRTDSMILMSVNIRTGRAVTFSLPRNMMNAQFPDHTQLHDLYPYGFTGPGDPGSWMLNAVYRDVPLMHPDLMGPSDNPGADALKLAIQGSTGLQVDYYVLVNLRGFQDLVDAMGGVTVNINTPVAVGGNTDAGIAPDDYLQPGPDQHLDGFHALWFARGRYGADDYQRMDRQRCMVQAIVAQASPLNVLRRFEAVAKASKELVYTDIPQQLLPALVDLALHVKDRRVKSVVFRSSEEFNPGDPDFTWLRQTVHDAIKTKPHSGHHHPRPAEDSKAACAYTGPAQ
jgi:LCP family protein required for cell wall assembly